MTLKCDGSKGFLTSFGQSRKNEHLFSELLESIFLPKQLTTIKMPNHSKLDIPESKRNQSADNTAKRASLMYLSKKINQLLAFKEALDLDTKLV